MGGGGVGALIAVNFAPKFPHNSNGQFYECVNSEGSCQRRKDNDNDNTIPAPSRQHHAQR